MSLHVVCSADAHDAKEKVTKHVDLIGMMVTVDRYVLLDLTWMDMMTDTDSRAWTHKNRTHPPDFPTHHPNI